MVISKTRMSSWILSFRGRCWFSNVSHPQHYSTETNSTVFWVNPLNAELNPVRHLLALVGARHIVHVSRIRVNVEVATTYPLGHNERMVVFEIRFAQRRHNVPPTSPSRWLWSSESHQKCAQEHLRHTNGSAQSSDIKSSDFSAGPCIMKKNGVCKPLDTLINL